MSHIGLAVWIVVNTLLGLGLHYYMWRRLVHAPQFSPRWSRALTVALAALALALPLVALAARYLGTTLPPYAVWPAYLWMAVGLYLVLSLFGIDLVRVAVRAWRRRWPAPPLDAQRRLLLSRVVAASAAGTAGALSGLAVRSAIRGPEVRHVRVPLAKLHPDMVGTRLVQITDLHVGQLITRDYVTEVVRRVNAQNPDAVVITGDLVDDSPERLGASVEPLGDMRSRFGTFFVTGNHEYYAGVDPWLSFLPTLGIRVLHNERVRIGPSDTGFDLAGIPDLSGARHGARHSANFAHTMAGREPERAVVLLAHQPKAVYEAAERGVDLQISGHTHGGQIWPFTWVARLIFPFLHGLDALGDTAIYVSRGTGWVGPPARLGAPSELTVLELVRPA